MNKDLINYALAAIGGIILLLSFILYHKDFNYYRGKIGTAETDEQRIEYLNKALECWEESDGVEEKALLHIYFGSLYLKEEQYEKSISEFEKGIEVAPNFPHGYLARGTSYMRLQKYDKALIDFEKAYKLQPENPQAIFDIGWVYHKRQEYDKALVQYDEALKLSRRDEIGSILRSKGILLLEKGSPEEALEVLRESFKYDNETFTALLSIIAASEISDEAFKTEMKKLDEISPENDWERTLAKFYQGNITEAKLLAEANKAPTPKKVREHLCEAYYYSGKMAQYKGDEKKAKEYMELTLKQNIPEFIEPGLAEAELARRP